MAEAVRTWLWTLRPPARAALAALLLAAGLIASASDVSAHATLLRSEPADGAVSATAPARFALVFSEPISPVTLRLIAPDGTARALGQATAKGATLHIEGPAKLARGTHALSWRVVSQDGHPVGGSLLFSVGAPSAGPAQDRALDGSVGAAIWAAKVALYAGLFFGAGGAFALAWLGGGRSGAAIAIAATLLGLGAAPLSLGLQGVDALGATLAALSQPTAWTAGWGTSYGRTVAVAAIALALAFASLRAEMAAARALSAAALLGVGGALAASGHAAGAAPQLLMRPMVFLHGVGVAFWLGALAPLGLALKRRDPKSLATLRRFSRAIPVALAPIVLSGLVLAVVQLGSVEALRDTAYGQALLAKSALLTVLFGLAAANRWSLTSAAEAGEPRATRSLMRSIAVEFALALAILGVVALWRFTPPPRALALAAAEPARLHIHTGRAMADIALAPGRSGPVSVSIALLTGDFGPLDAKQLTLALANPEAGIEPIRRTASKPVDGAWRVEGLAIPAPGRWRVRLDILVSDFELTTLEGEIEVRP